MGCDVDTGGGAQCAGEFGGLIVAAGEQAPPMERYRHEQIGTLKNVAGGSLHPTREQRHGFEAVRVLEA